MIIRSRVSGHYTRFWGDAHDELGPSWVPEDIPEYVVMVHAPHEDRSFYSFGTLGFGTVEQPAGGPQPRLEFVGYASGLDRDLADAMAALGRMLVTSNPRGEPWKAWDTVDLGPVPIRYRQFVLLPPPEKQGFERFNDETWSPPWSSCTPCPFQKRS